MNDDFPFREFFGRNANEKFIFKPNNQVTELSANSSLSIGIEEGLEVTFRRRGAKDLDTRQVCFIYNHVCFFFKISVMNNSLKLNPKQILDAMSRRCSLH